MPAELRESRFRNIGDPRRRDRFKSTYELGARSPFVLHAVAAYERACKLLEETLAENRSLDRWRSPNACRCQSHAAGGPARLPGAARPVDRESFADQRLVGDGARMVELQARTGGASAPALVRSRVLILEIAAVETTLVHSRVPVRRRGVAVVAVDRGVAALIRGRDHATVDRDRRTVVRARLDTVGARIEMEDASDVLRGRRAADLILARIVCCIARWVLVDGAIAVIIGVEVAVGVSDGILVDTASQSSSLRWHSVDPLGPAANAVAPRTSPDRQRAANSRLSLCMLDLPP